MPSDQFWIRHEIVQFLFPEIRWIFGGIWDLPIHFFSVWRYITVKIIPGTENKVELGITKFFYVFEIKRSKVIKLAKQQNNTMLTGYDQMPKL